MYKRQVNYQYKNVQCVAPGGGDLHPDIRVELAVQAIAKALHSGGNVLIFCKKGIHRTGALCILVNGLFLLDDFPARSEFSHGHRG